MANIHADFEILEPNQYVTIGWKASSIHFVYDVKMVFTCKNWWVKYGNKTSDPDQYTYAGFVSRDSVHIALTYDLLNGVDVVEADINNSYLQAPSSEKHCIIFGGEFGI